MGSMKTWPLVLPWLRPHISEEGGGPPPLLRECAKLAWLSRLYPTPLYSTAVKAVSWWVFATICTHFALICTDFTQRFTNFANILHTFVWKRLGHWFTNLCREVCRDWVLYRTKIWFESFQTNLNLKWTSLSSASCHYTLSKTIDERTH